MKARSFRADRLDIPAFTGDAATLGGDAPLASFDRLAETCHPSATDAIGRLSVTWQATGEQRTPRGGILEQWVHLAAATVVPMTCQRCLTQVDMPLRFDRWFRFAPDEATAAALDAELEEDVLVQSHAFDLEDLIEDELLLELPLAPHHQVCPSSEFQQSAVSMASDPEPAAEHPFAALAGLKRSTD